MSRDADSFYVQDCRQVQNSTHSIQTLTGQISRLVGTVETEKDFQHCRQLVDDAVRKASETRTVLARIREHQHQAQNAAERNNRRMMYQKLSDNLAITARVLEDVVRRFTAEERRRPCFDAEAPGAAPFGFRGGGVAAADAAGGEGNEGCEPLLRPGAGPSAGPSAGLALGGLEFEEELRRDRNQALQRVDEDMRCLQRIYTDLATAAEEQQTSFDTLESHMASAAADIERGRDELELTSKYDFGRRLKRRLVVGAGGLVAFIVVTSCFFSS